jgi:hypothetical protein
VRLFQNFSFWNSYLEFKGKPGFRPVFPRACSKPTGFWNKLEFLLFFKAALSKLCFERQAKLVKLP